MKFIFSVMVLVAFFVVFSTVALVSFAFVSVPLFLPEIVLVSGVFEWWDVLSWMMWFFIGLVSVVMIIVVACRLESETPEIIVSSWIRRFRL